MMKSVRMQRSTVSRASVKPQAFSLQKAAQTAGMVAASLAITLAAHADTTVLLGSSSGALVFEPSTINGIALQADPAAAVALGACSIQASAS